MRGEVIDFNFRDSWALIYWYRCFNLEIVEIFYIYVLKCRRGFQIIYIRVNLFIVVVDGLNLEVSGI